MCSSVVSPHTFFLRWMLVCCTTFVLLCFLACSDVGMWTSLGLNCNPTTIASVKNSERFKRTFGKDGAPGCLRIGWGDTLEGSNGTPVFLGKDGSLKRYEPATGKVLEGQIELDTPKEAKGLPHFFALFLFGDGASSGVQQSDACRDDMSKPGYTCSPDEKKDCWMVIHFEPGAQTPGRAPGSIKDKCEIDYPGKGKKEPTPNEPNKPQEKTPEKSVTETVQPPEPPPGDKKEPWVPEKDAGVPEPIVPEKQVSDEPMTPEVTPPDPVRPPDLVKPPDAVKPPDKRPPDAVKPLPPWLRSYGGPQSDFANHLVIDKNGNVIVIGGYEGIIKIGTTNLKAFGKRDVFVAKFGHRGNVIWAVGLGSTGLDLGSGVATDSSGNVYVIGNFKGNMSLGAARLQSAGSGSMFLAKLSSNGQKWLWAKEVKSAKGYVLGQKLAVDSKGDILVCGQFSNTIVLGGSTFQAGIYSDGFVAKMSATGQKWLWAKRFGGKVHDQALALSLDSAGNVYFTGFYGSSATFGTKTLTSKGAETAFLAKITSGGNWGWSFGFPGTKVRGLAVTVAASGHIFLTGHYIEDVVFGKFKLVGVAKKDFLFVAKFDAAGTPAWAKTLKSSSGTSRGSGITVDDKNALVYVTGLFTKSASFTSRGLSAPSKRDIFVAKMNAKNGDWLGATQAGGDSENSGTSISLDAQGVPVTVGYFSTGTYKLARFGTSKPTSNGDWDLFIWKYKP